MKTQHIKNERIDIRVTPEEKKMFLQAHRISGDRTFSGFITRIVKSRSVEIIEENKKVLASERDRKIFFETAEIAKFTPDQIRSYEDSLKYYRDLKNSLDTAKEEGKLEVATEMVKENEPVEKIIRFTGLPREQIERLKKVKGNTPKKYWCAFQLRRWAEFNYILKLPW